MSTSRPFAYNPLHLNLSGTTNVGDLCIGVSSANNYKNNYGGLIWWKGPNEDLGYVIAVPNSGNTQPTPYSGVTASVGFWGTEIFPNPLTDTTFINLVNGTFNQTFTGATQASNWLTTNGYWNSYIVPTPTPTTTITPTPTPSITQTITPTPSITQTMTPTNTLTPTITPTNTLTPTPTPTKTLTPTPTVTLSSGIITDSLFMKLDATNYTSGVWLDETVNGNNATINGATWSSTDGGIFDLNGTSNTISIPHTSNLSLNTTTQRTIQVWVKFDVLPALNVQIPVFGKLSSSYGFDGYWGGLFSNGGKVRSVTNGTGVQRIVDSTLTVTTNTWYLFTFISQITSTANTTKVYINTTEYITTAHGTDGYSESNPLYLGYIGTGISSTYLNGKIGACYFYTKGLNSTEITNNYNVTKSRFGL
jgi:hypothetical protein